MRISTDKQRRFSSPSPLIEDVPDDQRRNLLYGFIYDSMGNEDLMLIALDRAKAGTPELHWGDHCVNIDMLPDGQVVITQLDDLLEDHQKDSPPQTVITIAEARKLIRDWIAARDQWYAEREATQTHTSDEPESASRRC